MAFIPPAQLIPNLKSGYSYPNLQGSNAGALAGLFGKKAAPTPDANGQAGTPQQPINPFYFGPNVINPEGTVMPPGQVASPAQAQMGKLQTFMQQLQDPTRRMELVTMLGQTQPAPQDQEIQTFFADLGGTPNATG